MPDTMSEYMPDEKMPTPNSSAQAQPDDMDHPKPRYEFAGSKALPTELVHGSNAFSSVYRRWQQQAPVAHTNHQAAIAWANPV